MNGKNDVLHIYSGLLPSQKKKKDEIMSSAATRIRLEMIILSEISQKANKTGHYLYVKCNI